ncbi:SDR family NAD(P)-dependent oxidoreductase [Geodermatophilus ruber]|uniref:Short-chain dehydrogenase n=1 Tax=Geodermatophilus ruber TaxID=504800 RepID=A0A1I4GT33_9ACTN|nr:SDR family NAD(P)-dependent oxidoreductase [Geodermatophilus ruber]SFL33174.1 Short-chain dehydrogenase [Geodermatophilus ruber]
MSDERPLALVTGASSGIGLELARQFADAGFDLIVNAEDAGLTAAAEQLRAEGAAVRAVQADLRTLAGVEALWAAVQAAGRPVTAAALDAGVGKGGPFLENDIEEEMDVICLDIVSTVRLTKLLLRDMVARNEGRLLITSSIAATMPGPYQAVYNASKSFLQSFAEALVEELDDTAVAVTSLMPGPTGTHFFERAGIQGTRIGAGPKDDPAQVARQGFEALMAGKEKVVAGSLTTKAQELATTVLPDRLKAMVHRQMAEPGSAGDR